MDAKLLEWYIIPVSLQVTGNFFSDIKIEIKLYKKNIIANLLVNGVVEFAFSVKRNSHDENS